MKEKIGYINTLKGLACLGVFLHHLFLIFLPATYSGQKLDMVIPGDYLFGCSPLGVLFNGNFYVCLFILISSFLLSGSIFLSTGKKFFVALIKRYPRLMLPVLAVNIISQITFYFLNILSINVDNLFNSNFLNIIKLSLFDIWVTDSISVAGYWMMHLLFIGSYISIIVSLFVLKFKKDSYRRIFIFSLFPILIFFSTYFAATIFGVWIAFEMHCTKTIYNLKTKIRQSKASLLIFTFFTSIIVIYLGGYPSAGIEYNNVYAIANYLPLIIRNSPQLFHIAGALFAIILCFTLDPQIFKHKVFDFLSDISYSVFLIHPVIHHYFTIPFFSGLKNFFDNPITLILIVIIVTIFLVVLFSYLFYKIIECRIQNAINYLVRKFILFF